MDNLKYFLDNVIDNSEDSYKYDRLDNLAEIYKMTDIVPIALIEWHNETGMFHVRFRIGMSSIDIAKLTRDMAVQDCCINFDEDFIIDPQYGYLYGEEASQAFINRIQQNIQQSHVEDVTNGAIYVVQEPIFACGSEHQGKTKLEKLWDSYGTDDV